MKPATVADLAALVGGRVEGDGDHTIHSVADVKQATAGQLSFIRDRSYAHLAKESAAADVDRAEDEWSEPASAFLRPGR